MRLVPEIFEAVQSGRLFGPNRPNGRVTVVPSWSLRKTATNYGNSNRGPFRYYRTGAETEYEIPAIESIDIQRSLNEDAASCTITIFNAWHEANDANPELVSQLGKPGFFWPKHGQGDAGALWGQTSGKGAYTYSGTWDSNFSWENILVEDALVITRQGYGGVPTGDNYVSIESNVTNKNIVITGVWKVDTVSVADGKLTITCKDMASLLLEQMVFPPLIPTALYPLEYYPAGKSAFDSYWGPKIKTGVSPASRGEVRLKGHSWTGGNDPSVATGFPVSYATDGNNNTYALSEAFPDPNSINSVYFEFTMPTGKISSLTMKPWAGGYTAYVSIRQGGVWLGGSNIPDQNNSVPYVHKQLIPFAIPDGREFYTYLDLPYQYDNIDRVRITFQHLYYSPIPDASGNRYRAGIREIVGTRTGAKVSPYDPGLGAQPWTFAMAAHPVRGYWVCEADGTVHGFGDAADYDSNAFGNVPLAANGGAENRAVDMAATPSGKGYWVLDWYGRVYAYGDATHYGQHLYPDPWVPAWTEQEAQAISFAPTYTGNGYWVGYTDGYIRGFGDADPVTATIPDTPVSTFMEAWLSANAPINTHPYNKLLKLTSITAHPTRMGLWSVDGSGQVRAHGPGGIPNHGSLINRVYNKGGVNEFKLEPFEWATKIEATKSGNGYWITFGSGRIAAFKGAINQGPVDIYESMRGLVYEENIIIDPGQLVDPMAFRHIVWSMARDPDGSGFWVLRADGKVFHYDAEFWGNPGYHNLTGYRWHEGNFSGDPSEIVRDLLMWSGFTFYDSNISPGDTPGVLGAIESLGIRTDTTFTGEKFDKKTIMDCIREMAEVATYSTFVDEEGGFRFQSANIWSSGNRDLNGDKIYVQDGTFDRVDAGDPNAVEFIPVIHELRDLVGYTATLSNQDKRSEIIIGTEAPDPKDRTKTGFVRRIPVDAQEEVYPGVLSNRGIERPAIWPSHLFENSVERDLMAELIDIHAWFAKRTGSVKCVANPCLSLEDQVRVVERGSSESYIHRITSISSNMNLETGEWFMDLQTHWLGDADEWVLVADAGPHSYPHIRISEPLNSWQSYTQRELDMPGSASTNPGYLPDNNIISLSGDFDTSIIESGDPWQLSGQFTTRNYIANLYLNTVTLNAPLGNAGSTAFKVWDESNTLIKDIAIGPEGSSVSLGSIGHLSDPKVYRFELTGVSASHGTGEVRFTLSSSLTKTAELQSTVLVVLP